MNEESSKYDELVLIIKESFDQVTHQLKEIQVRQDGFGQQLTQVEEQLENVGEKLNGTNQMLHQHLRVSDDQHHEIKTKQITHEQWLKQLARKTKTTLKPAI